MLLFYIFFIYILVFLHFKPIYICHTKTGHPVQPLEWILNLEDSLHSLQHLKTEVQNCAFFGDLSTATTKYLRLWRPAYKFKIHSKGKKTNVHT